MERKPAKICRACEPCRRRKVRCNGGTPCQHPGCQSNPVECRYRIKARNRISLKRSAEPSKEASGLPAVPPSSSLATAIEDAPNLLPVDDGQLQTRNGLCTLPSAPSDVAVPCPMSPEQSVYDSITATHHAPTATDSSQLFYGPSSNFAFLHQVHRGTLQNVPVTDLFRRRDVQEGGPGLDMFMQRTLFFGTPSRVSADVIWPASCLQQIPRDVAKVYLGHFKTVYLARFPFFTPSELDLLFDDFYTVEHDSEKSMLLPQTKAGILAALALGALCTPQTNTAETLLMQSKSQVMMYDDAVTLQMLQLSLLSSEYQLQMGRLNSAYLHLGAACRKAFALGLHKETNATSDSQDALRRQRATIWTLYCHETLSQLSVIAENAAETIYGCRSVSLLQLYEKSEKVHVQLRQFAEQFGIASATTGHNKSIFDDASSILLHNLTLAFRPFLVADSALRSSEMVPHDDEMWLRHACRSAVSAAQDSIAFTSSMFRKPNAVAPVRSTLQNLQHNL
ncbi:c6 zinc finger domain containing protein [Grosmannia clavigera kw1407]|uniref:C6 zinc finger domain containing protein n=1 Tax=Grosmannia clavigera (strain kw1407 / UAMH 11150) TaxID=655863 RepID=F0XV64_GROCL|nr:c6 zinc finger domain containing protein [Grosmannia clavigera kw1407]EFW98542.1 c6 zinc finger domain containing protein [Grosmannia clavigera kw1407]